MVNKTQIRLAVLLLLIERDSRHTILFRKKLFTIYLML